MLSKSQVSGICHDRMPFAPCRLLVHGITDAQVNRGNMSGRQHAMVHASRILCKDTLDWYWNRLNKLLFIPASSLFRISFTVFEFSLRRVILILAIQRTLHIPYPFLLVCKALLSVSVTHTCTRDQSRIRLQSAVVSFKLLFSMHAENLIAFRHVCYMHMMCQCIYAHRCKSEYDEVLAITYIDKYIHIYMYIYIYIHI
jgi:hypothetical protein